MSLIETIAASAGGGKTTRLAGELETNITSGDARPDAIIATTFTNRAAAELQERTRSKLLSTGRSHDAQRLMASRIGTVNSVCASIVEDYAFELGMPPGLRTLDEDLATTVLRRALSSVVDGSVEEELQELLAFMPDLKWERQVERIIQAARTNEIGVDTLMGSHQKSVSSMDAALGPCARDGAALDAALKKALEAFLSEVDQEVDGTNKTNDFVVFARQALRHLDRETLSWPHWCKLTKANVGSKSAALAEPIRDAAKEHVRHPRLRGHLGRASELLFSIASRGLVAYQELKAEMGMIDFVDQEVYALDLLRRDDIRARLKGEIDLVLIDEFQDTSPVQLAIFLELAALSKKTVWVGDQKQAIYGFRGTDPGLMDSAIEDVYDGVNDHDLVPAALASAEKAAAPEILSSSWRSRPELVALTNDIFAPAFDYYGIPEERTRLTAERDEGSEALGPVMEYWPLQIPKKGRTTDLAPATAAGVRRLLREGGHVVDRATGEERRVKPADVAVLCRTNKDCQRMARALEDLGIRAVLARHGLFDTPEAKVLLAALRLWIDKNDSLAAAEIARLVVYSDRPDEWLAAALAESGGVRFMSEAPIPELLDRRTALAHAGVLQALDTVISVVQMATLCGEWGEAELRRANLDAIRAHAVAYVDSCDTEQRPATVVGLLARFKDLATEDDREYKPRRDNQAVLGADNAVTVCTWHKSKGLEWPVVVLFGIETTKLPSATGVHVASETEEFDASDPLAGRWVRYWPHPYQGKAGGPVRSLLEQSPEYEDLFDRSRRETLRVLYVIWTRARDRLVLTAMEGKFLTGVLGELSSIDETLISEPTQSPAVWAGRRGPSDDSHRVARKSRRRSRPLPASSYVIADVADYPPAFIAPSGIEATGTTGAPIHLGDPIQSSRGNRIRWISEMRSMAFLAADSRELDDDVRESIAEGLLTRWGLEANLDAFGPDRDVGSTDGLDCRRSGPTERFTASGRFGIVLRMVRWCAGRWMASLKRREGGPSSITRPSPRASTNRSSWPRSTPANLAPTPMVCVRPATTPEVRAFVHLPLAGQIVEVHPPAGAG